MRIRLPQIQLELDYTDASLLPAVAAALGVAEEAVRSCVLVRRSIDARRSRWPVGFRAVVEADVDAPGDELLAAWRKRAGVEVLDEPDASAEAEPVGIEAACGRPAMRRRPVVVGAGPAGLLAAWRLAEAGCQPILIERGAPVEERRGSVGRFWSAGVLDADSNVLFGEGGAGLCSDGKLTTQTKRRGHLRCLLELLVDCGADASILIDAQPHLGSDRLAEIVPRLRERIVAAGGEVRFHSRLEALALEGGRLAGLVVGGRPLEADHCVLATGHSARDVYEMLGRAGVALAAKPMAVGVRIEAPQGQIDASQFGPSAGHPRLGAASYRLTRRAEGAARPCYTFCMCPGGSVIACASEPGMLTTNGMSFAARAGAWGNAGFLVPAGPDDFGGSPGDPLAGLAFQGEIEARAFRAGGGGFVLPACTLGDFIAGRGSPALPAGRSCPRSAPADLHEVLPGFVSQTLRRTVGRMMRQLREVDCEQAIVYAAETRSSSPVRIVRDETLQSPSARGLYPVGEGAGYAGGIVTSAIDGLRAAEEMLLG